MIEIINPSRVTKHSFFSNILAYLDQHEDVILRDIKREFADVPHLDRLLEQYITKGLIKRENKRYCLTLPFLESLDEVQLDQELFIRSDSPLYPKLEKMVFQTEIRNQTNEVIIEEPTTIFRDSLTLSNYFYKLNHGYPLSPEQEPLYAVLGDVNPEYALKYMTTFLLKFVKKDQVPQKRRDIFVDSLVLLGYIAPNQEGKYELQMGLDKEELRFYTL
ncbi:DUF1803 domain-containing protein [Streptococcus himalayensis]|uniref:DUF1803 domain-containing protein n=1 Tax=Streptococcus himalayensis TaxID=1888195 RepID=A0A917A6X0_9STRE|nr:DUF1803 domain-containing protein [Streptococcus himalayensis]GGE31148.1 hypothetical protein GCM10011510_10540 [Streptococcus himalayensis]